MRHGLKRRTRWVAGLPLLFALPACFAQALFLDPFESFPGMRANQLSNHVEMVLGPGVTVSPELVRKKIRDIMTHPEDEATWADPRLIKSWRPYSDSCKGGPVEKFIEDALVDIFSTGNGARIVSDTDNMPSYLTCMEETLHFSAGAAAIALLFSPHSKVGERPELLACDFSVPHNMAGEHTFEKDIKIYPAHLWNGNGKWNPFGITIFHEMIHKIGIRNEQKTRDIGFCCTPGVEKDIRTKACKAAYETLVSDHF